MKQVQLNVDDEFAAAGDAVKSLISDIKAKKSITEIAANALPNLIAAVGGYSSMAADVKKVDNQVYLIKSIADALEAP
jgi:hypothetical protein